MQVCGGMRRREDREPGPWHYLARMLGVGRGEGTETSGLWQPRATEDGARRHWVLGQLGRPLGAVGKHLAG